MNRIRRGNSPFPNSEGRAASLNRSRSPLVRGGPLLDLRSAKHCWPRARRRGRCSTSMPTSWTSAPLSRAEPSGAASAGVALGMVRAERLHADRQRPPKELPSGCGAGGSSRCDRLVANHVRFRECGRSRSIAAPPPQVERCPRNRVNFTIGRRGVGSSLLGGVAARPVPRQSQPSYRISAAP
jgi:hypothetical protein